MNHPPFLTELSLFGVIYTSTGFARLALVGPGCFRRTLGGIKNLKGGAFKRQTKYVDCSALCQYIKNWLLFSSHLCRPEMQMNNISLPLNNATESNRIEKNKTKRAVTPAHRVPFA